MWKQNAISYVAIRISTPPINATSMVGYGIHKKTHVPPKEIKDCTVGSRYRYRPVPVRVRVAPAYTSTVPYCNPYSYSYEYS